MNVTLENLITVALIASITAIAVYGGYQSWVNPPDNQHVQTLDEKCIASGGIPYTFTCVFPPPQNN